MLLTEIRQWRSAWPKRSAANTFAARLNAAPHLVRIRCATSWKKRSASKQISSAVRRQSPIIKPKHPMLCNSTAARAALTEARNGLRRAVFGQPAVLRNTLAQANAAEQNLEVAVREQEKAALALNKAAIGYQELARQAETDRALYESVLRQIKETNLTKDVKTNAVSIAEHGSLRHGPSSTIPSMAITLGLPAVCVAWLASVL